MINSSIAALDLPNTYEAKGEAAKAEAAAKAYADGLATNYDAAGSAAAAETAAKAYADGLATNYDAAGSAAAAETAAKAYADGLATNYEVAGAAAAVEAKLTTHTGDAVAHVTADERTAWNSAKTAIDAFLKDADMTEKAVDTLAELQTYMTTDGEAAAKVVERIGALEAIDHDAYKAADETVLASAKSYADGLAVNYEVAGAAAQALVDAKADAASLYQPKGDYEATGAAAQALVDAKADAASLYQPKGNYEAAGAAAQALADAKADAASLYQPKGNYEAAGTADAKIAALDLPNSYDAKGSADAAQAAAIAQAKLDAAEALKVYYTKTEVDNLLSTNSSGDRAYAKQYTDELFNSFVFAQNSDIDAIFTVNE